MITCVPHCIACMLHGCMYFYPLYFLSISTQLPVDVYRRTSQHLDAATAAAPAPRLPSSTKQSSSSQPPSSASFNSPSSTAALPSQASLISSRHNLHDAVTVQLALNSGCKEKDDGFPAKFAGGDGAVWLHPSLIGKMGAVSDQQVSCDE